MGISVVLFLIAPMALLFLWTFTGGSGSDAGASDGWQLPLAGVLAVTAYLLFDVGRAARRLTVDTLGFEYRSLFRRQRLAWADFRQVSLYWVGELPVLHLTRRGSNIVTLDTTEWVPADELADRVLLAVAAHGIHGRELFRPPDASESPDGDTVAAQTDALRRDC